MERSAEQSGFSNTHTIGDLVAGTRVAWGGGGGALAYERGEDARRLA